MWPIHVPPSFERFIDSKGSKFYILSTVRCCFYTCCLFIETVVVTELYMHDIVTALVTTPKGKNSLKFGQLLLQYYFTISVSYLFSKLRLTFSFTQGNHRSDMNNLNFVDFESYILFFFFSMFFLECHACIARAGSRGTKQFISLFIYILPISPLQVAYKRLYATCHYRYTSMQIYL